MSEQAVADTTQVRIEVGRPGQEETFAAVAARTFPLACPPGVTDADVAAFVAGSLSPARFAEYLADADRLILGAWRGETLVGYVMVVWGEPEDPEILAALRLHPTCDLDKCYVVPEEHGAGVSAALVRRALDAARDRGLAGCYLGVNQLNARAQRFYTKQGFEIVGPRHFPVGDQIHDDWVMECDLTS